MYSELPKTKKRKRVVWAVLAVVAVFLFYNLFFNSSSVFHYVFSAGSSLKQTDGRVNILLLGYGGGNHDGVLLTDSIIVASINLQTHNVALFSIPRDLWLPGISEKINAAYETGLASNNGLGFAEDKIDDILGIKIHYGVSLDFN